MARFAYQASHEQFSPKDLLRYVKLAEQAGFDAIHSSDHFAPWNSQQGESGYSWAWLGAAMTSCALPFGVIAAPGQRQHPVIIAQAISTLLTMFDNRLWISLGSGQALNELVTGEPWPPKTTRQKRVEECAQIIRQLFRGEECNHDGLVKARNARLYTLPDVEPAINAAALSIESCKWAGGWADGLLTASPSADDLQEKRKAFVEGGGGGKPIFVKVDVCYAKTEDDALAQTFDQWRTNLFPGLQAELKTPQEFEEAATHVRPEDLRKAVTISKDANVFIELLKQMAQVENVDTIVIHNVGLDQEAFIQFFGDSVLSKLKSSL